MNYHTTFLGRFLLRCFVLLSFWLSGSNCIYIVALGLAMMVRRMPGRFPTMLLIILSVTASCRYLWWRYSSTLNWDDPIALFWGVFYFWRNLLLDCARLFSEYMAFGRKPISMPKDESSWPTIDLMIPTYNEDLDVIKATVYASLGDFGQKIN
ncbi:hypothetical protein OH492_07950 [Vibrio chagasii]|nr:hypothetical protein [Vibrio chagasii]